MAISALSILVVEDDAVYAESIAFSLRAEGNHVVIAATAEAAVMLARKYLPQAVVLDLKLPDGHGYDVARRMRHDCVPDSTAIIALTGTDLRALAPSESAGIDLVLSKPVKTELLAGLLHFVHGRRRSHA